MNIAVDRLRSRMLKLTTNISCKEQEGKYKELHDINLEIMNIPKRGVDLSFLCQDYVFMPFRCLLISDPLNFAAEKDNTISSSSKSQLVTYVSRKWLTVQGIHHFLIIYLEQVWASSSVL